jgi:peroxiredoxin
MRPRWTANTWVLVVLLGLIVVIGAETARAVLKGSGPKAAEAEQPPSRDPAFKVGDAAPDFSLPDRSGTRRSLSSLVKGETVLFFMCGCSRCRDTQNYLGKLRAVLGPKAPKVVSVSTTDPAAEASYRRDVKLDQTILYEGKASDPTNPAPGTPVMDMYKGHPCPRVYRLAADRTVKWIGKSPDEVIQPEFGMYDMAGGLGFRYPGGRNTKGPEAPPVVEDRYKGVKKETPAEFVIPRTSAFDPDELLKRAEKKGQAAQTGK